MPDRARLEWIHQTQKGLAGQKPDLGRDRKEFRNVPICLFLINDRGTYPDVSGQWIIAIRHRPMHVSDIANALCEKQPIEIRRMQNEPEQIPSPLRIHRIIENIRKTGAKTRCRRPCFA